MKRLIGIIALLTLVLAGCGEKTEAVTGAAGTTQQFTLMLDWTPNADHSGIYQALAEGDFTRAGLDVNVQVPADPASPLALLAAGKVDAAISYEPEVLLARNQGQALVSVAAIVQEPLTSIVSIGSKHIKTPADLKGKRVGDAGIPYQHAYLTTILARAGVPQSSVKEINVGANLVPAMLSGRVDATLGSYWNYEALQLAMLHKHPNVIHMNQVGRSNVQRAGRRRDQERDRQPPGRGSPSSFRRWRAAMSPSGATRRRPWRTSSRPARDWTRSCSWPASRPPSPTTSRATPACRGAGRTPRSGTTTGRGC